MYIYIYIYIYIFFFVFFFDIYIYIFGYISMYIDIYIFLFEEEVKTILESLSTLLDRLAYEPPSQHSPAQAPGNGLDQRWYLVLPRN